MQCFDDRFCCPSIDAEPSVKYYSNHCLDVKMPPVHLQLEVWPCSSATLRGSSGRYQFIAACSKRDTHVRKAAAAGCVEGCTWTNKRQQIARPFDVHCSHAGLHKTFRHRGALDIDSKLLSVVWLYGDSPGRYNDNE
jgi:hypothetical protein